MDKVFPGDSITLEISLLWPIPMSEGLRFAIREQGKTIGIGQVVELIDDGALDAAVEDGEEEG